MKTHCLRSLVGASSLAIAAIASLVACSAEDATVLESDLAEELEVGGFDSSIPLEEKYEMELTADERARLDAHYASRGIPEDQVSYQGRVITVEGDMMVDADYLLSGLDRGLIRKQIQSHARIVRNRPQPSHSDSCRCHAPLMRYWHSGRSAT
mgnify:CR=1 FL=1